jgi:hypothetical protein
MDKYKRNSIAHELDYSLTTIEDRKNKVNQILEKHDVEIQNHYDEYFSVAINKSELTSDYDFMSRDLEKLADYLLYVDNKTAREEQSKNNPILSPRDIERNYKKEFLTDDLQIVEMQIQNNSTPNRKKYEKIKVTKKDREEFEPLKQTGEMIERLKQLIETGVNSEGKVLTNDELKKIKWFLIDLRKDEVAIKEKLKGYITFKKITRSNPVYDLENFSFSNMQHVKTILDNYSLLHENSYEDTSSDIKVLLFTFEELVEKASFSPYLMEIFILKIDGLSQKEICEQIYKKYKKVVSEQWLSQLTNTVIPKMITQAYLKEKEDWIYTFVQKGIYKNCTKCKQNKLATHNYFNRDKKGKYGLKSICKKCCSTNQLNFSPYNDSI